LEFELEKGQSLSDKGAVVFESNAQESVAGLCSNLLLELVADTWRQRCIKGTVVTKERQLLLGSFRIGVAVMMVGEKIVDRI
jgi:hypothetical protein